MPKFILYACPVGPLGDQIQAFLDQSRARFGPNAAHAYMPHCTLTGFFSDDPAVVPGDLQRLDRLLARALPTGPRPAVRVTGWGAQPGWLGLELESPWLCGLARDFADLAKEDQRQTPVTPKPWLHLTLANAFHWHQQAPLAALARQMVDPEAAVSWELRYYQRDPGGCWRCHRAWGVPAMLPGTLDGSGSPGRTRGG